MMYKVVLVADMIETVYFVGAASDRDALREVYKMVCDEAERWQPAYGLKLAGYTGWSSSPTSQPYRAYAINKRTGEIH